MALPAEKRIKAFELLGNLLIECSKDASAKTPFFDEIRESIAMASACNSWFTTANIQLALLNIGKMLEPVKLVQWVRKYDITESQSNKIPSVGIIMAGNIPAVGFHDLLCVLISGCKSIIKLSSDDPFMIPAIVSMLQKIEPGFVPYVSFDASELKSADAMIATGSDNTARYFEYHYACGPHIFRKNRNSIATLSGEETGTQLSSLADDILSYYGLGCRNVSKIYVPHGYNFEPLLFALKKYESISHHQAYMHNYNLQKALLTLQKQKFYDNGFLILKRSQSISSGIAVLNYASYDHQTMVEDEIALIQDKIQCIVSGLKLPWKTTHFGETQQPALDDYADGIDTMQFLMNLKRNIT